IGCGVDDLVGIRCGEIDRIRAAAVGRRVRDRGGSHDSGAGIASGGGRHEGTVARLDLIEDQISIVADDHSLPGRDLYLTRPLVAVLRRARGGELNRLSLSRIAAEYLFAAAVLRVREPQQAALNLGCL